MNTEIYKTMRIVTIIKVVVLLCVVSACDLFNNEQELFDDYGFEEGYYYWGNDTTKIPLLRYKGHLSIEFRDFVSEEQRLSVLDRYGIEPVYPQFISDFPGFYRVTRKPASYYYTTYQDTSLNRLGNLIEVDYVLPAFELDDHDDVCDLYLTTNQLSHQFHEYTNEQEQELLLDSLRNNDGVILEQYTSPIQTTYYALTVTKNSKTDPYQLVHHYHDLGLFKSISIEYGLVLCR